MKKIVAVMLMLCMVVSSIGMTFADSDIKSTNDIDVIDALIISSMYLNSNSAEDDILSTQTTVKRNIPLYNNDGNVIAYYVNFSPSGYAVVNNNINNPTVIEFGNGQNQIIEDLISNNPSDKIIYNSMVDIRKMENNRTFSNNANEAELSLYDYYPDLLENNLTLANEYQKIKKEFVNNRNYVTSNGYGFIDLSNMPSNDYTGKYITGIKSIDWATTYDFSDIAEDHCAAVAATNLALFYSYKGFSNLIINNSTRDTFIEVHKIIPDGPIVFMASGTKEYFEDRGYTLKASDIGNTDNFKSSVNSGYPCAFLLGNNIADWHWILGVGYRDYPSDGTYFRIVDGWHNTVERFYKPYSGSVWAKATQYQLK